MEVVGGELSLLSLKIGLSLPRLRIVGASLVVRADSIFCPNLEYVGAAIEVYCAEKVVLPKLEQVNDDITVLTESKVFIPNEFSERVFRLDNRKGAI